MVIPLSFCSTWSKKRQSTSINRHGDTKQAVKKHEKLWLKGKIWLRRDHDAMVFRWNLGDPTNCPTCFPLIHFWEHLGVSTERSHLQIGVWAQHGAATQVSAVPQMPMWAGPIRMIGSIYLLKQFEKPSGNLLQFAIEHGHWNSWLPINNGDFP
jgi:hypothetical protein